MTGSQAQAGAVEAVRAAQNVRAAAAAAVELLHTPEAPRPLDLDDWRAVLDAVTSAVGDLAGISDALADALDVQLQSGKLTRSSQAAGPDGDLLAVVSSTTAALDATRAKLHDAVSLLTRAHTGSQTLQAANLRPSDP